MKKKYIQTKNLPTIFDLSVDYFQKRMNTELVQGVHYFIPPSTSKTKKAVLWNIEALENWIKGHSIDNDLNALLERS